MKYGDIVVYGGEIGEIVTSDGLYKFKPRHTGMCSYSTLDTITENDVREATHNEKLEFIESQFTRGYVVKIHCIGEYQIVEWIDKDNKTYWHVYINYISTNTAYYSLDEALVGAVGYKYEGGNGRAAMYFSRMIGIKEE